MQISILALGSRGDVQPLVALGRRLVERGHRVRLASFRSFAPLVTAYGLDFTPVNGDAQAILSSLGGQALSNAGQNPLRTMAAIQSSFGALKADYQEGFQSPALWECDRVVCQLPGVLYARDACEALGIPLIQAAVIPLNRTRTLQNLFFPPGPPRLPGYNALTHRLAERLLWWGFRDAVHRWRRDVWGLRPTTCHEHFDWLERNSITLYGFSPQVVPRPPDWGARISITGYWPLAEPDWQPTQGLVDFLQAGPPPVMIGFGSMTVQDRAATRKVLLSAARAAKCRLVLHSGWAGLELSQEERMRGDLETHAIDYTNYTWLFPRLSAVVHHGGSGTTGAALTSGTPSLVIPFSSDQFFWGQRSAELGVGPAPIPFKRLTVENLTSALIELRKNKDMRSRASALGEALRTEDGLGQAAHCVETFTT